MKLSKVLFAVCALSAARLAVPDETPPASAPPPSLAELHAACDADIQKLCTGVQPGGGRILACLKQQKEFVSDNCKLAIVEAVHAASEGTN